MDDYIIYFELFGRKMKTTITAKSEEEAKKAITQMIKWHKIEKKPSEGDEIFNYLKNLFNK